ncbi:hypothetical protein M6B38_332050 [Iris pallida]|uniref:Uncharacterized protein n=1 Tax=Iris pallida TaxID=29817 RepID=A0AAX6H4J9_IRIPA|nr:hypothetical protein M6B38_332050 [Iris pallida]
MNKTHSSSSFIELNDGEALSDYSSTPFLLPPPILIPPQILCPWRFILPATISSSERPSTTTDSGGHRSSSDSRLYRLIRRGGR